MEDLMFDDIPKAVKLNIGRWVHIYRNKGEGYRVYDAVAELELGRILVDDREHWIYNGDVLSVEEQEEIAEALTNPQPVTNVTDWSAFPEKKDRS